MRFIIFALLLSVLVFAQLPEENISPPSLPSGKEIPLTLKLFFNQSKVSNIHARVALLDENGHRYDTLHYVPENGELVLNLDHGWWGIHVLIDDLATPGKDFTYETQLPLTRPEKREIHLFPVGSIKGTIYRGKTPLEGAEVTIYCTALDETLSFTTTASAAFLEEWIPQGTCTVVAVYEGQRKEVSVQVVKGAIAQADIHFSEPIYEHPVFLIVAGLISLAVALYIALRFHKKWSFAKPSKKHEQVKKEESAEPKKEHHEIKAEHKVHAIQHSKRSDDIVKTLNPKEKRVVGHLMENKGKSTQVAIKNDTGIPKTSLHRIFTSLEAKNVISIERVGKLKKISLTTWFLGNE